MCQNRSKRILVRTAVLLLLLSVAGLSSLAKHSKYLPKSNPLRHFSKSAKMVLVHHPVDFVSAPVHLTSRVVPPQLEFSSSSLVLSERLILRRIGLTVSFQHRAPPSLLA
jgi:hypothetical protein